MGVFIGFIIGGLSGITLMSLIQINNDRKIVNAKKVENILENERGKAIKEKQDINYINGMSRIIYLYKTFYKEELQ